MTNKEIAQQNKKILQRFADIDSHIAELEQEQDMWWSRLTNTSPVMSDMPHGGANGTSKVERGFEQLEQITRQIDDEIDRLLMLRNRITRAISAMDSINEQRVLRLAYIGRPDGNIRRPHYRQLKLWQIANEMNYSVDHVNRLHGLALKNIRFVKTYEDDK